MTSAFSWQNSYQPLPCFILYSKAKFACYSRYLLISYFCIPVPYSEKEIFLGCQFQKVLQVFIELFNLSFFSITGQGIDLNYCDIEWFALEINRGHFVTFEVASKYCISDSLLTMMATPFLLRDSCPQQQIKWSSELNSPIPVHFSSLIPKMLMFTCHLLIDLFQFALIHGSNIPGSYATLLFTASDITSITSHIYNWVLFCFCSVSSFFLKLFLH